MLARLGYVETVFRDRSTAEQQTTELRESLAAWIQQSNDVKILVTHQVNISALTGQYASSGDMLIVTLAEGSPVVLEQISTR